MNTGLVQPGSQIEERAPRPRASVVHADHARLREEFDRQGYVVFRNVVSKDDLAEFHRKIVGAYDRARASGKLLAGGGSLAGHLNCAPGEHARFAYDSLRSAGIVDLIDAILPGSVGKLHVGCNYNLPGSVVQHYHTDSCFLEAFMIANVAVVDTDLVNGAIDVAPGTNREFYKYWRFAVERPERRRLPLSCGDVVIRASTLWHRGMPNLSSAARPMIAFTFGDRRAPQHESGPFGKSGDDMVFYENWFRPNRLGRLRERAFIAVPIAYDAMRFVRSLVDNRGYAVP